MSKNEFLCNIIRNRTLLAFFLIFPLYSQDHILQQKITDPMGYSCNFSYRRILKNRNISSNTIGLYLELEESFFDKLEPLVGLNEYKDILGSWSPNNSLLGDELNSIGIRPQGIEIIIGTKELIFLKYNTREASKMYKYENYYIIKLPIEESIDLIILLDIFDNKCFLYSLEENAWLLFPSHKAGENFLQKEF